MRHDMRRWSSEVSNGRAIQIEDVSSERERTFDSTRQDFGAPAMPQERPT